MWKTKQILLEELSEFGPVENLNEQAKTLVEQQKFTWEIAFKNFDALNRVEIKTFDFGHFKIIAQFNPERIRSSAAKTDAKSIAARPCFLCLQNLPEQQKGLIFQEKYLILANPFPIFPVHLTISLKHHLPQFIKSYFPDMLELSKNLPDFTVFYNGPNTGASAPDHFHFQAAIKGFMPFERELELLEQNYSVVLFQEKYTRVFAVKNYLRNFVAIISSDLNSVIKQFEEIYQKLDAGKFSEPPLNILCNYEKGQWKVLVFPREKQRPSHFYQSGEKQLITGPAAVELGGILVLPRREDFNKISKNEVAEIYNEVAMNSIQFEKIFGRKNSNEN